MLVKYWMRKALITIDTDDSMQEAMNRLKDYHASLLPVLKKGKLVGVITDRDLKRASASDATTLEIHELLFLLAKIKAGEIMTKNPITVPEDYTLEETAAVLLRNNISGAPVVDSSGRVVGTISQREIFKGLISLTGLEKRGVQFAFETEDRPGSIKELTDIVREFGGRLVSIMTSYEKAPPDHRHVYVRAYEIDREKMPQLERALAEKATLLYVVDLRDGRRAEYVQRPELRAAMG